MKQFEYSNIFCPKVVKHNKLSDTLQKAEKTEHKLEQSQFLQLYDSKITLKIVKLQQIHLSWFREIINQFSINVSILSFQNNYQQNIIFKMHHKQKAC